jgi:L-asparaginase II
VGQVMVRNKLFRSVRGSPGVHVAAKSRQGVTLAGKIDDSTRRWINLVKA